MMQARHAAEPEPRRARIGKGDHPRILHLLEVERRKVADVAAEYGCTPANIYALAGRLRRLAAEPSDAPAPAPVPPAPVEVAAAAPPPPVQSSPASSPGLAPVETPALDLFAAAPERRPEPVAEPAPPAAAPRAPAPAAAPPRPAPIPAPVRVARPATSLAKSGYGLAMRNAEGDESVAPFRSLEDLLSGIKPILRDAAGSADPVWFSIRPIDLASIDSDAA